MKYIESFIAEKLKINKDMKSNTTEIFSKEIRDKILDELCIYFQGGGSFGGDEYSTRLQIVDKFFHKDIAEYFRRLFLWEDLAELMNVDKKDFMEYVKTYKDDLYEKIKDFVLV